MFYTVMKGAVDFVAQCDKDREVLRAMIVELSGYEVVVFETAHFKSAKFILGQIAGQQERSAMIAEILASYKHHRGLSAQL